MGKSDIHITDWNRILFGNAPPEFLLEALLRAVVMYSALLIALRLMGKRMNNQLTITELAVMISLGAIISLPIQSPERGIINGLLLLTIIVIFQRGLAYWSLKSPKVEKVILGPMDLLVKDGILQIKTCRRLNISSNQISAKLRERNIHQLGEVARLYLEPNGIFSLFKAKNPPPGLCILPIKDKEIRSAQHSLENKACCSRCGFVEDAPPVNRECPFCQNMEWVEAVS